MDRPGGLSAPLPRLRHAESVTKIQDLSERLKMAMGDDNRPDLGLREQTEKVFEEAKELRRLIDEVRILRRSAPD